MNKIRQLRRERGISVKVLAQTVGVSEMTIYRYEQEKRIPQVTIAAKIAEVFGCNIDDLLKAS